MRSCIGKFSSLMIYQYFLPPCVDFTLWLEQESEICDWASRRENRSTTIQCASVDGVCLSQLNQCYMHLQYVQPVCCTLMWWYLLGLLYVSFKDHFILQLVVISHSHWQSRETIILRPELSDNAPSLCWCPLPFALVTACCVHADLLGSAIGAVLWLNAATVTSS